MNRDHISARLSRAIAYTRSGKIGEAQADLVNLRIKGYPVYLSRLVSQSENAVVWKAIHKSSLDRNVSLNNADLAIMVLDLSKHEGAIDGCNTYIKLIPEDPLFQVMGALSYRRLERPEEVKPGLFFVWEMGQHGWRVYRLASGTYAAIMKAAKKNINLAMATAISNYWHSKGISASLQQKDPFSYKGAKLRSDRRPNIWWRIEGSHIRRAKLHIYPMNPPRCAIGNNMYWYVPDRWITSDSPTIRAVSVRVKTILILGKVRSVRWDVKVGANFSRTIAKGNSKIIGESLGRVMNLTRSIKLTDVDLSAWSDPVKGCWVIVADYKPYWRWTDAL